MTTFYEFIKYDVIEKNPDAPGDTRSHQNKLMFKLIPLRFTRYFLAEVRTFAAQSPRPGRATERAEVK